MTEDPPKRFPSRSYWPREVMLSFLQLYRSLECLWRVRSPSYTNRFQREQAYQVLLNKVREVEPFADREYVACKINSIRTSFRKELAKVNRSKRLAAFNGGPVYKPRLWYFDYMMFIVDQNQGVKPEPSSDGCTPEDPNSDKGDSIEGFDASQFMEEEYGYEEEEEEAEIKETKPVILEDGSVLSSSASVGESSSEDKERAEVPREKRKPPPLEVLASRNGETKRQRLEDEDSLLRQALGLLLRGRDEHAAFGEYLAAELRQMRTDRFRRKLRSRVRRAVAELVDQESLYLDGQD